MALATLVVTQEALALLGHREVHRLQVAGRVNCGTVVDAFSLDGSIPLAHIALGTVLRTFLALSVTTPTAFQLHTARQFPQFSSFRTC